MYNKKLKFLLDGNPNNTISKTGIMLRKIIDSLYKKIIMFTTHGPIENVNNDSSPKEKRIIYASSHGFHDDLIFTMRYVNSYVTLLYANLEYFFHTFHGIGLFIKGVIIFDRKNKKSRNDALNKMCHAINNSSNILICPESTYNLHSSKPVLNLYSGVYDVDSK